MSLSEPDYDDPGVVRINSIALGLVGGFLLILLIGWWFGRGEESPPAAPTAVPEAIGLDKSQIMAALARADTARGSVLYQQYGCANCHSLNGSEGSASSLMGIRQRIPPSYVSAEEYLADVILDPETSSRTTYTDAVMPSNYDELLLEQDVADLIVFILEH